MQKHVRARVIGRVQGVSFRFATAEKALELGVAGHVRNLADGSVEFDAQGSADAVNALCDWAKRGPPFARVDKLIVEELILDESLRGFKIRP